MLHRHVGPCGSSPEMISNLQVSQLPPRRLLKNSQAELTCFLEWDGTITTWIKNTRKWPPTLSSIVHAIPTFLVRINDDANFTQSVKKTLKSIAILSLIKIGDYRRLHFCAHSSIRTSDPLFPLQCRLCIYLSLRNFSKSWQLLSPITGGYLFLFCLCVNFAARYFRREKVFWVEVCPLWWFVVHLAR